jgi:hypothetical protein
MKLTQSENRKPWMEQRQAATFQSLLLQLLPGPYPQPSLRIPVTPGNKEHLRALRAAEDAAFEAARPARTS